MAYPPLFLNTVTILSVYIINSLAMLLLFRYFSLYQCMWMYKNKYIWSSLGYINWIFNWQNINISEHDGHISVRWQTIYRFSTYIWFRPKRCVSGIAFTWYAKVKRLEVHIRLVDRVASCFCCFFLSLVLWSISIGFSIDKISIFLNMMDTYQSDGKLYSGF